MRRARWIVAAVLLIAIAAIVWWMWTPTETGAPAADDAAHHVAPDPKRARSADEPKRKRQRARPPDPAPLRGDGDLEEEAPEGFWVVKVVGPDGQPVWGVEVHRDDGPRSEETTNSSGRAWLPWNPDAANLKVRLVGAGALRKMLLKDRFTLVRLERLPPLDIVVVDAETGDSIAPRGMRSERWRSGYPIPANATASLRGFPMSLGRNDSWSLSVTAPDGYANAKVWVNATVSRFADSARLMVPLRREARIRLRAVDTEGRPLEGARVDEVILGSEWSPLIKGDNSRFDSRESGSDGVLEIRQIPYYPDTIVSVRVVHGKLYGEVDSIPLRTGRPSAIRDVKIQHESDGWNTAIGIGGGAGGAFGGRRGGGRAAPATLQVHVVRRNGTAAPDTLVRLVPGGEARTDAHGWAVFAKQPPGKVTISVFEPGFVPVTESVKLEEGQRRRVELREPAGKTTEVLVPLPSGKPARFANLEVSQDGTPAYVHRADGYETLSILTDAEGRCRLTDLAPGKVTVRARFGGRETGTTVHAGQKATITLPPLE